MELSIQDIKELISGTSDRPQHKLHGKKVVAVLPNGFIHFGTLKDEGGMRLECASNLRYWSKREGGLPEFAANGPIDGDRIDAAGNIYLENVLFFYECGVWS